MNEITSFIDGAERGGLIDLGKALRALISGSGGVGGGATAASLAEFRIGTDADKFISPAAFFAAHASYTLMDAEPIVVNMNNGLNFLLTLVGDRTISNPINYKIGQSGIIVVQQDAVGNHTLDWGTSWKFINNTPPVVPTPAHAWTLLHYYVQATDVIRVTAEGSGSAALNSATVEEIRVGLETLKYVSPATLIGAAAPVLLIDEPTILIDLGLGQNFMVTISSDRLMDAPLDQMPGRSGNIIVKQDATGGRSLTWDPTWKFIGDQEPSLPLVPNAVAVFRYYVESIGNVRVVPQLVPTTASDFWIGTSADTFLSPVVAYESNAPVVLTGGLITTPDFNEGLIFSLTVGGPWAMGNPINQKAGQSGMFYLVQGLNGTGTVDWGTNYQFVGGITPLLSETPGAWTVVPYYVFSPGTILCTTIEANYPTTGGGATISPSSVAEIRAGLIDTKYISPLGYIGSKSPVTLTDGPTVTPDMASGTNFLLTLGDNRAMANMVNQKPGVSGFFIIMQDATGGRTLSWGNNYSFAGGTPIIPTAPDAWLIIPYHIQVLGIIRCIPPQLSVIPPAASVAEYRAATVTTKYITPAIAVSGGAPVSLTDGATIAVDFSTGINFKIIIAGNRGISNPSSQIAGQEGKFIIYQDATGGRTLSWGDHFKFESGAPVLNAGANAFTTVAYYVEASGTILMGA